MTTCAATQLKPPLCSRWVAMCSAWKRRSAADQRPGTTMVGETPPSSLVIGLAKAWGARRLGRGPGGAGAPGDRVVGGFAAGDVYGIDTGVGDQVVADGGVAGDDA